MCVSVSSCCCATTTNKRRSYSLVCHSTPWVGLCLFLLSSLLILISTEISQCDAATFSQNPKRWNEEEDQSLPNGNGKTLPKEQLKSNVHPEKGYPHVSFDDKVQKKSVEQQEGHDDATVAHMGQEDRKKLQKQKRIDRSLVRRVLNSAKRDLHYDVLGLRTRWNYPLFDVLLRKRITPKDIKRAFYKMAKLLHPDKNLDDRAEEAFIQLERSAKILLDEVSRSEYDTEIAIERKERRKIQVQIMKKYFNVLIRRSSHAAGIMIHVIKPIYAPVLILGALLI